MSPWGQHLLHSLGTAAVAGREEAVLKQLSKLSTALTVRVTFLVEDSWGREGPAAQ